MIIKLIQYTDKRGGAIHILPRVNGTFIKTDFTACGKEMGVTLRPYRIWEGKPEEVNCKICRKHIKGE